MFRIFTTPETAAGASAAVPLMLHNTLGNTVERFTALRPPKVTLYTCGPTVYDYPHIGNMRAYVFADVLKRTLQYNGYEVKHTMNLTDFGHLTSDADEGEDKVMIALRRAGLEPNLANMRRVVEPFIDAFTADMEVLNNLPPTQYTRASDYVTEQIALIGSLVEKGYTYETSDGIYFDVTRFPHYGALGNIDIEKLREGARIEVNPEKRHPADFALWKKAALGWDSTWGKGFPGWHIECAAMAFATLGKQIDIHTGGEDHIATHHNGEIAEAEAATGRAPFVRYWLHNAFITIDGKKISKSLGNGITLQQLRDRGYPPLAYRYWTLTGHYRTPMNFTFEALTGAKQALFHLKRFLVEDCAGAEGTVISSAEQAFHHAINDDLDTPRAIALIWELVKDETQMPGDRAATIRRFDDVLGIGLAAPLDTMEQTLGVIEVSELPEEVQKLIAEREQARAQKRWDDADALREAINLKGYLVKDTPKGPRVTEV